MRRSLIATAVGLLAVAGCAHDRATRQETAAEPPAKASVQARADVKRDCVLGRGRSPCGGSVQFGLASAPPAIQPMMLPDAMQLVKHEEPGDPAAETALPEAASSVPAPLALSGPTLPLIGPNLGASDPSPKPGPAQGYQVLTGSVESWRKTWRLRYAPIDVEEAHGGRVTLVGDSELDRLREGQHLWVRGLLVPSDNRAEPPTFHVQSLEVVD